MFGTKKWSGPWTSRRKSKLISRFIQHRFNIPFVHNRYLLTEWKSRIGIYLARGDCIRTEPTLAEAEYER